MNFEPKNILIGVLLLIVIYYIISHMRRVSGMTGGPKSFAKARDDSCPEGYEAATEFLCIMK